MRFREVRKHKVVDTTTADTVAKVSGFVVDPATRSVIGLEVKKADHGSVVGWADLTAVGTDAVTIAGIDRIVAPEGRLAELQGKAHRVLGKRVLSTAGDELGEVKDVDFDGQTGAVNALLLEREEIAGARLLGVGSYAVVVATV